MTILYVLLAFVLVLAVLSILLPSSYKIEKSITIPKNIAVAFNAVADLKQYKEWNPWQKQEPNATYAFEGMAGNIGHKYNWNGKKIGEGSLTLRKMEINKVVEFDINFIRPFKSHADDCWTFEKINENECKVIWNNTGSLAIGMPRLMGPMVKKMLTKQFEQGLQNLKQHCEKV